MIATLQQELHVQKTLVLELKDMLRPGVKE